MRATRKAGDRDAFVDGFVGQQSNLETDSLIHVHTCGHTREAETDERLGSQGVGRIVLSAQRMIRSWRRWK